MKKILIFSVFVFFTGIINVSGQVLRYKTYLKTGGLVMEDKSYDRFYAFREDTTSFVINSDSLILRISDRKYLLYSGLIEAKGKDGQMMRFLLCEDDRSNEYTLTIKPVKDSEDFDIYFAGKIEVWKYRVKEIKSI